jgi:hypothetical protein
MYIIAPEPISTTYFICPSNKFLCLYVYSPPIVARQWIGKNDTAATNTYVIEELLDASSSMRSVYCQKKVSE